MDLSTALQIDYLTEFKGKKLAIATFPKSHSFIDLVGQETFLSSRPSVGCPLIFLDGTFISKLDNSGTFARTFSDFSTATIRMSGSIDYELGTIDDECVVVHRAGEQASIAVVNFMKGFSRDLFEIPQDEENASLLRICGKIYVQTDAFDSVKIREFLTGELCRHFSGVHDVIHNTGVTLTKVWKEDGTVELHCKNLEGDHLFQDQYLGHVPLTWSYNEQGTFLAINGSHTKLYALPQFYCIDTDRMCRWITMSKCGHFAGAQSANRLDIINLDEQAIAYSLELERYWSHSQILPGGNLVLLDNRGSSDERFEWKLARNPNESH